MHRPLPLQGRVTRIPIDDLRPTGRVRHGEREFGRNRIVEFDRFRYAVLIFGSRSEIVRSVRLQSEHVVVARPHETAQFRPHLTARKIVA